ncbi:hypothetical protein EI94DRAFT_1831090 [Lactarius quietus]|nr:hypothetical protein EI94DRAFT_1831090 [Lactarius quietus]
MSQASTTAAASSRFQVIFQSAVKSYQKQTKTDILAHPLASQLQSCDSTVAILVILQDQVREFDKSHSGDERLTKWLGPTVNVLSAFSSAVSGGVSLVFSPTNVIFAGIGVFAAQGVAASKDVLAELFERIGFFFTRLETYTDVAPTTAMTDIITQIMVEVLRIFAIATKELRRGSAKKFFRKLAGMADLEDALKKLDRLTQEEARMVLAEVQRITHTIRDEVTVVDRKVESVQDKVEEMGDKVADIGDKVEHVGGRVVHVGDRVEHVGERVEYVGGRVEGVDRKVKVIGDKVEVIDDKVEVIDDKVEDIGDKLEDVGGKVEDIGDKVRDVDEKILVVIDESKKATVSAKETKSIIQQKATDIDKIKWNQLKQLLQAWLSPSDPSTNHNIVQKCRHEGTAMWLFQGKIVIEWRSTGSLLWIHGKPGSGKSVICSSVIQDIMAACETGSAIMAYFYFDFRDLNKQTCHDLLRSLVFQLSTHSSLCCDILHRIYETPKGGTQQPSDDTLQGCLIEMLRLLAHGPVFIVLDAIDECPDSPGLPPPRSEVLQLVKELVDLHLRGLYICASRATSRPEVDIRAVFEPLVSPSVSLHDESGQKEDIADYVRNVVNSSPSTAMRRWRAEDNMASGPLTTTIASGRSARSPSLGDASMPSAPPTPPPLTRAGTPKGGCKPLKALPGDVDLSVFDILNIFRRCWFLSRSHLLANTISAQKAEDGKITWVEFSPPFHSHLVKCAVALVPRPVPQVKRVMFVFVLELLNREGHMAFFDLQKGGCKANYAQKEKQCLARKQSRAAKREWDREAAKVAQLPPHERQCLGCGRKFASRKTAKKHKCSKSKVVRIKEAAVDGSSSHPVPPTKPNKPAAFITPPAPTAPAPAVSRQIWPLPSHSTTVPPVTGGLGVPSSSF